MNKVSQGRMYRGRIVFVCCTTVLIIIIVSLIVKLRVANKRITDMSQEFAAYITSSDLYCRSGGNATIFDGDMEQECTSASVTFPYATCTNDEGSTEFVWEGSSWEVHSHGRDLGSMDRYSSFRVTRYPATEKQKVYVGRQEVHDLLCKPVLGRTCSFPTCSDTLVNTPLTNAEDWCLGYDHQSGGGIDVDFTLTNAPQTGTVLIIIEDWNTQKPSGDGWQCDSLNAYFPYTRKWRCSYTGDANMKPLNDVLFGPSVDDD